jgi:hypothetical protein
MVEVGDRQPLVIGIYVKYFEQSRVGDCWVIDKGPEMCVFS